MKGRDEIKELFSEKLGNYEAKVNPELWTNIASQIGAATTTAAVSTGISVLTKWIIGASIASAVAVTAIVIVNNSEDSITNEIPKVGNVAENNSLEEQNQAFQDEEINKSNVIEQITSPKQSNADIQQKENSTPGINDQGTDNVVVEPKPLSKPPVLDSKPKNLVEKGVKEEENRATPPVEDPVVKDPIVIADVIIENQTPEEAELSYKIGELRNVFTPNGDGVNDIFFIESEGLSDFNVVVMDAQSKVVFQSNNPDFNWDGNDISGNPFPAGRYVYFITAKDKDGAFIKKGNGLTIKR